MSNVDVTRTASPKPQLPVDESVKLPASVLAAAAKAESYYGKEPASDAPPVEAAPAVAPPADNAPAAPQEPVAPPVQAEPPVQPKPRRKAAPAPVAPSPAEPPVEHAASGENEWEHRYRSMKGRYDASQQTIGAMQEQMTMLGDELTRTQTMLMQNAPQHQPEKSTKLVTDKDVADYGNDLIDLTKRAALEAVAPQLTQLEQDNTRLRQQLQHSTQLGVTQLLDREVPDWREINRNIRFKQWLALRNIYSGVVRKRELDAAYQAADAPRVLAFFKGFVSDEVATGNMEPDPTYEQPVETQAPRQAAVPLENLSAPGRVRPAGGNAPPTPADKPIYTRAQIANFYTDVRRGIYAGREGEKSSLEQAIFAAQREGRVR